ncbi:TIGR02450 family Trp-rich protein [Pseudomonas neustonica]|uniref:TIGR02450 family Trp-rich protein n=1 Tax=Pseudomonas neustonica TaxID=2487346 RepID=UPI003C8F363E|tara:strand:+ start:7386 stop:7616 length:231 start_codon:yes stop_codon:yes gene_type:complete
MMANQNRFNPRKLLRSKWTARQPQHREKHFMVTACHWSEDESTLLSIELEAVLTGRCQQLDWQDLHDADTWQQGWK